MTAIQNNSNSLSVRDILTTMKEIENHQPETQTKDKPETQPNHRSEAQTDLGNPLLNTVYVVGRELVDDVFNQTSDGTDCETCLGTYAEDGGNGTAHETSNGIGKVSRRIRDILLRLVVIDSRYSTNMNKNCFGFEELATAIAKLGDDGIAARKFNDFLTCCGSGFWSQNAKDIFDLFNLVYGIRKDGASASRAVSLITKYAFFLALRNHDQCPEGFPIYDSLAIRMTSIVTRKLGGLKCPWNPSTQSSSLDIVDFITFIKKFKSYLWNDPAMSGFSFKGLPYDIIDAYLWRMGKFDNGNIWYLFTESDYKTFMSNVKKNVASSPKGIDDQISVALNTWNKHQPSLFAGCSQQAYFDALLAHYQKL